MAAAPHLTVLAEWHVQAPIAVGMFRAESAGDAGDPEYPEYDRLVSTLMDRSPEFRHFWQKHEVASYTPINKRLNHPNAGRMVFEYNSFTADGPVRSSC